MKIQKLFENYRGYLKEDRDLERLERLAMAGDEEAIQDVLRLYVRKGLLKIEKNEKKIIYRNSKGQFHNPFGPAIEYANGTKEWYQNGQLHREGGPAIEYANGTKEWCINGLSHREDGPVVEYANGTKEWLLNNKSYGTGKEPPQKYLEALQEMGVEYVP